MILTNSFRSINIELKNILYSFPLILTLLSCGADIDSSSGVEGMFSNVLTIQNKMADICSVLNSDDNFNISRHEKYGSEFCSDAPSSHVIDLNSVVDKKSKYAQSEKIRSDSTEYVHGFRVEVYANTGILEGAQKAVPTLKDLKKTDNSDSQFSVKMIEDLKLDEDTLTATAKMELTSTEEKNGYSFIQNQWKLYGKKIKNYFLVALDTYKANDSSLLRKAHIMLAVVPHAGDIYINIIGQFHLKSHGVDEAMSTALTQMVTDTLYDIKQKFN